MAVTPRCRDVWTEVLGNDPPPEGYLPPGCCSSCHEDEDYGYPLCNPELPDGRVAEVCCAILGRLDDD